MRSALTAWLVLVLSAFAAGATELHIDNPVGAVYVRAVISDQFEISHSSPTRDGRRSDLLVQREENKVHIECRPLDGAVINVRIDVPFGSPVQIKTFDGKITLEGFHARGELITEKGVIELIVPWSATRFLLVAQKKPKEVTTPKGFKFTQEEAYEAEQLRWVMRDKLSKNAIAYGRIRVRSNQTKKVTLKNIPIPDDSPVKMTWQAEDVVRKLRLDAKSDQRRQKARSKRNRSKRSKDESKTVPSIPADGEVLSVSGGPVLFSSDVRLVNLTAAVTDSAGRPMTGLGPKDFGVVEEGEPQQVEFAGSEEVPFNLVLLLDLSASTRRNRDEIKEAVRRFAGLARPQDRVAVYALANNMFLSFSPLTEDRERLTTMIDALPPLSGGSPVYDSIALSFAQELEARRGERNAIIVLSDGADNRLDGIGLPSKISFKDLLAASPQMETLIYPIFLGASPEAPPVKGWPAEAYNRFGKLAALTGGRVFAARSVADLEPVYKQVTEELRSVYSVAYYPENQTFDGAWREVRLTVARPGAVVRARSGYTAR